MHILIVVGYSRRLLTAGIKEFERRAQHGGWKTTRIELDDFLAQPNEWTGYDDLAIAGGDGTVRACLRLRPRIPIVIVPTGTGNDLARSLGIFSIGDSARYLCAGYRRRIDLGSISHDGIVEFFANGIGFGLDGVVARSTAKHYTYSVSILRAIHRLPSYRFQAALEFENVSPTPVTFLSLLIANGSYFGGGYRLSPRSVVDDGLMEVVQIEPVSRFKYIQSIAKARRGAHINDEQVHSTTARRIRISSDNPMPCHIDGEYREIREAEIKILPKELTFYAIK